MNLFKGLVYVFAVFGLITAIMFGGLAIQPALDALDSVSAAAVQQPVIVQPPAFSPIAREFLDIAPRTEWPEVMCEVNEERLLNKFLEGAAESGRRFTPTQVETIRREIIPRFKELMARSVEKAQGEYWFWYWRPSVLCNAMIKDQAEDWGPRYSDAIAEIASR